VEWFKAWPNGILRGSLSKADDSIQLIWIKMLSIASETHTRNGRLEFRQGKPMSKSYLVNYMCTTMPKLTRALEAFKNDFDPNGVPRITIEEDSTIVITKWEYYQKDKREPYKKPNRNGLYY